MGVKEAEARIENMVLRNSGDACKGLKYYPENLAGADVSQADRQPEMALQRARFRQQENISVTQEERTRAMENKLGIQRAESAEEAKRRYLREKGLLK